MPNICKRTYPIHAFVGKRGCELALLSEIANARTNRLGALTEALPSIGYIHYKFRDEIDAFTALRTLKINVGISLCCPDDYKNFSSVIGKEMACDLADGVMQSNFLFYKWERDPGDTQLHYVDEGSAKIMKNDDLLDYSCEEIYGFRMRQEIVRVFDRVELTIYSNLQNHRFRDTFIKGKEFLYIFNQLLVYQLQYRLYWCVSSYMHKRFPKFYVALKEVKMLPIKNFTKIIPVRVDAQYTDLTKFHKKHKDIFRIPNLQAVRDYHDAIIGYIAIRIENGKVYTGCSYVHPSDFLVKRNKYGKRLAYSRLMRRVEHKEDGVDELTKKLCRRDDMDIQHVGLKEVIYYNYGYNGLERSVKEQLNDSIFLHGVQEENIESFVNNVMKDLGFEAYNKSAKDEDFYEELVKAKEEE